MGVGETLELLRSRWGHAIDLALEAGQVPRSELPEAVARELRGPVAEAPDAGWLRRANIVGVNLRTIGGVWPLVPYSLTLPAVQSAIHLLPVTEPGVAASLYGPISWNVDPAIASEALAEHQPGLADAEAQLRAVVHLLHVTGRAVGMDVIPHTDRFSEIALAQPGLFEWLERRDDSIVRHGSDVTAMVEAAIVEWLVEVGTADDSPRPASARAFFDERTEATRTTALFGVPADAEGRRRRRIALVRRLHGLGLETVPATMAPPYRGLEVDPRPDGRIVDDLGMAWREFRMIEPTSMSRVFGPLTRFLLYEEGPGGDWTLDPDQARSAVWEYVVNRYAELRARFGFDFMRGDMAHVQPRPRGVATRVDDRYDILGAVAAKVRADGLPSFGFLAESFLAGPGFMAYGDEADHLEAAGADTALGDLQSVALDHPAFVQRLRWYRDLLDSRTFAPSFTVITADKDDPRFDAAFRRGNDLRFFIALFLADMPSYMSLGFEQRDPHIERAPNERYSKLYVFQLREGANATRGPYEFGQNLAQFEAIGRIRRAADDLRGELSVAEVTWLRPPDATAASALLAWTLSVPGSRSGPLVCLANLDLDDAAGPFALPVRSFDRTVDWSMLFTTVTGGRDPAPPAWNGRHWLVDGLGPGEARLYRIATGGPS